MQEEYQHILLVAFKTINNGPLKLVVFYHDGKRIDENKEKLIEALMQVK